MFTANLLQDRVVVITGGGSGLGQWFATAFVEAGARVYISGRRQDTLESTVAALNTTRPGSAKYLVADNTREEDMLKLVKFVTDHEAKVDVLINNAGTAMFDVPSQEADATAGMASKGPFPVIKSDSPTGWEKQFAMFAWAPYTLTVNFLPLLAKAAKLGEGRGSVIMISSIAARFWNPYLSLPGIVLPQLHCSILHIFSILCGKSWSRSNRLSSWSTHTLHWSEGRKPSRLYLCRAQLLPNPRITTPWQVLYETQNDRAYITTMGFNVATFNRILAAGFDLAWNTTPIPRDDAVGSGKVRPGARSLDA